MRQDAASLTAVPVPTSSNAKTIRSKQLDGPNNRVTRCMRAPEAVVTERDTRAEATWGGGRSLLANKHPFRLIENTHHPHEYDRIDNDNEEVGSGQDALMMAGQRQLRIGRGRRAIRRSTITSGGSCARSEAC